MERAFSRCLLRLLFFVISLSTLNAKEDTFLGLLTMLSFTDWLILSVFSMILLKRRELRIVVKRLRIVKRLISVTTVWPLRHRILSWRSSTTDLW